MNKEQKDKAILKGILKWISENDDIRKRFIKWIREDDSRYTVFSELFDRKDKEKKT